MSTKPALHLCRFSAEDVTDLPQNKCHPPRGKCQLCSRKATRWVVYVWGGSKLCATCAKEECGS